MPESLTPAAVGVASTLKSLRTRAGLQERRLASSELDLDVLKRLDRVRKLVAEGVSPERAIVSAVTEAVRSLEPTASIVADVSLRLRLAADQIDDPKLYGDDLGDRRDALLAHWDRLHELRSVSPPRKPAPRALRLETETEVLGQLAAVLIGSGQAGAEYRDSLAPSIGSQTGSASPADWDRALGGRAPNLLELFDGVARALRGRLIRDADGTPQGWPHDLRPREPRGPDDAPRAATSLATAFGLKAMMLIDDHLSPDLVPVVRHLQRQAQRDGGYAATTQSRSRPEVTATVLDALYRVNATTSFKDQLDGIEEAIGSFERSRPYILTTVLEAALHLQPDGSLAGSLIDDLLAARQPYGDRHLWPEKAERALASPRPSTVHTARAVHALALAQAVRERDPQVQEAIDQAAGWLAEGTDLGNAGELIDRPAESALEQVYIRHFTPAWVAKALIAVGKPASHDAVTAAVAELWKSFHRPSALWCWDNGDVPIWMSFDGIEALKLAALATAIIPVG